MTSALKEELKKWLNRLAADEMKDPTRYHDSGMAKTVRLEFVTA